MAKKSKRREADFSVEEMAEKSGCKTKMTFMNRLKEVCEFYEIDINSFKMDGDTKGGESYFPAECGELLAILVKGYTCNPGMKKERVTHAVTISEIGEYYEFIMDDIEKLPVELRELVYSLPSYFTTRRIQIWLDRLTPILTKFIYSYLAERGDDIGALLQRICVDADKASYDMFWNYSFIEKAKELNWQYEKEQYEEMLLFLLGNDYEKVHELEESINHQNISIDYGIANLIKRLNKDTDRIKEKILDDQIGREESPREYDMSRDDYYREIVGQYLNAGDLNMKMYTLEMYENGARGWKTIEERILSPEGYMPEGVHMTYEEELSYRKKSIEMLEKKLKEEKLSLKQFEEASDEFKSSRNEKNTLLTVEEINDGYIKKCNMVSKTQDKLAQKTNEFAGQVLWNFLNPKNK